MYARLVVQKAALLYVGKWFWYIVKKTHLCTKGALVVEKSILFVHRQVIVALEHTILH